MLLSWLQRRRRARLLATPTPAAWRAVLDRMPFYRALSEPERARLRDVARVIVAEKHWEGCGGFALTEEARVTIAAQAARLLLGVEHDHFASVRTILVYPATYRGGQRPSGMLVSEGAATGGEAHFRGPVILSWDAIERQSFARDADDAKNLVLHEFAHTLDMVDGRVDGTPELGSREAYREWARVMTEEHERLRADARARIASVLDTYGATDEAEFFAVATEAFFEQPAALLADRPTLYALLARFYGQDPARR